MPIIHNEILEQFQSFNETEVRFHIIDPVMRALGYPGGPEVYIRLEEKLEYPYSHIGHRSKKDVPLGYPDYRAGVKGARGSFIVEAKSSTARLAPADVEQAHSYAAHAQVGANFFMLCDDHELRVYQTLSGPNSKPIVALNLDEIDERFHELENIISPTSLIRHCHVDYDLKLNLCDGLTSSTRIDGGEYELREWSSRFFANGLDITDQIVATVPQVQLIEDQLQMFQRDFVLSVASGQVERGADGRIEAEIAFSGVTKGNREAMRLLGIDKMMFATDDQFMSTDSNFPTTFESTAEFSVDKGTMIPPVFGDAVPADTDLDGDIFIVAKMFKIEDQILGQFIATSDFWIPLPGLGNLKMEYDIAGTFWLALAA